MVRTCPNCGSSEIDDDSARGDSTCMGCGTVLEESTIVADVTFQENSGGGHSLVGQFVSKDRGQPTNLPGVPGLAHQESREVTYYKGRKLIEEIASQLRINQHCVNTAFNFFKMCVSRNFTRGRVRSHVVAACLYMTCRLENTAHLLLDFSDITQVNVFDLGRTLNFLARSLKINLPTTDPCMYILRFAVLLDFGAKQKEVVSLATRLVQRMKRDWIATGRRPTGLCGAALLLAARCYNFNRTIGDVVRVVHVSEAVVRKRLDEFGQTPSSALTIDEFTTVDLEHSEDPPAFRESRRKARELQLQKEEETLRKIESEIQPMEVEVERALEKRRKERFKRTQYARMISGGSLGSESDELSSADAVVRNEIVDLVFSAARDITPITDAGISSTYAPSLASLGIAPVSGDAEPAVNVKYEKHDINGELDLEGIDDDEIDTYILTDEEVVLKTRFWMKLNGEHLKEMERRRREREEEEEREKDNPVKKRRRTNGVRKKEPIVAATAQEAMEKVIQEKKLSNKINYDILKEIEDADESTVKSELNPSTSSVEESSDLNGKISIHSSAKTHTELPEDKKGFTMRIGRTRIRKRVVPHVSLATKRAVEQTISTISGTENRGSEENISKKYDESDRCHDDAEQNKRRRGSTRPQTCKSEGIKIEIPVIDEASTSAAGLSTLYTSQLEAVATKSLLAGASDIETGNSRRLGSLTGKRKGPAKKLAEEETSEAVVSVSTNTAPVVKDDVGPSEKVGSVRSRYARMRPNLKSVKIGKSGSQVDGGQGPPSTNESEVPEKSSDGAEVKQKENVIAEAPSTSGKTTAKTVRVKVAEEVSAQETAETDPASAAPSENLQPAREVRRRYLNAKPNLIKQGKTKVCKKS